MAELILSLPNDRAGAVAARSLQVDARQQGNFEYLGDLASSIQGPEGRQFVFAGDTPARQQEPSRAAEWLRALPITFHLISTPDDDPQSLIRDLIGLHSEPEADQGRRGFILGIEQVPDVTLCQPPNGIPTLHSDHQLFMNQLQVPMAHANGNLGDAGTIALIDTGCDGVAIDDYYDLLNTTYHLGRASAKDTVGHGTGMAMIIREVAPNAELTVVRVADTINIPLWNVLAGIAVAVLDAEAEIINLSLGISNLTGVCGHCGTSAAARGMALQYLLRSLRNRVVYHSGHPPTFVAATGNSGYGTGFFAPARYDECLAVGSVNSYAQRSSFSTYGTATHLHYVMAPGGERSGKTATEYAASDSANKYSGTSISAAYASAMLALYRTDDPLADLMQTATTKVVSASPSSICGSGQIVYS